MQDDRSDNGDPKTGLGLSILLIELGHIAEVDADATGFLALEATPG